MNFVIMKACIQKAMDYYVRNVLDEVAERVVTTRKAQSSVVLHTRVSRCMKQIKR